MIGNSFWDDLSIDAFEKQTEIKMQAEALVNHWGKDITENDLLKLKAYSDGIHDPVEAAFAQAALNCYLEKKHDPEWIHASMFEKQTTTKRWWQVWER